MGKISYTGRVKRYPKITEEPEFPQLKLICKPEEECKDCTEYGDCDIVRSSPKEGVCPLFERR